MPALDPWADYRVGLDSPARHAVAIVPHDTNELAHVTRFIYVGGAGNIILVTAEDETVTLTAVPVGTTLAIQAKVVKSTGTTATALVALY